MTDVTVDTAVIAAALEEKDLAAKARLTQETVAELVKVRGDVIETMDKGELTRETAILAIDAMASETMRVLSTGGRTVFAVDEEQGSHVFEGLAEAYFDAINN